MRLLFLFTVLAMLCGVTIINAQEAMPKTQRQIWIEKGDEALKRPATWSWEQYTAFKTEAIACYLRAGLEDK